MVRPGDTLEQWRELSLTTWSGAGLVLAVTEGQPRPRRLEADAAALAGQLFDEVIVVF